MSKEDGSESEGSSPGSSAGSEAQAASTSKPASSKKASRVAKPRLTASQKNFNHKDAENKRRTAIRDRFTELSNLVPGAQGHERSEQIMLMKTTEYLREQLIEQRRLEEMAKKQGITIDAGEPMRDDDFGGPKWKDINMQQYEASKQKKEASESQQTSRQGEGEDD
ncbi:Transcription factor [Cladophialophora chaetospira]|uniref:Transcription factor n=1 Tax=Cladophialophora chaetospira TaxID=386627 RepID=A0AA39CK95_9EURO|nr:Transcription factor [Cladophialophora chaetospira]